MIPTDPSDLIDDSPESRNEEVEEKRSLLPTLLLLGILLLCVIGFSYGMYQVLYA